ncbi:MAG: PrgI family protein [Candidatus Pacebacteria bacterium]|nr:PrgI family protein [Candidatus Paceibacterota bacterium]MCD8507817.1 PrgI family protein [Candidatus Paceibacterota bacterium]MCD8528035.1 PrgI family protein [Candidatus Paceibacterota bacterium]MCD8563884.1 PrgI family protein [Candidatus Paceibacterota bacterium]
MRYQTPQFINIEDKIFGPLTFRQFVYILGGGGISYLLFRFLPGVIAIPLIVIVAGFALALAFYQVNNRPFIYLVQSMIGYVIRDKFYLWRKVPKKTSPSEAVDGVDDVAPLEPKLSESRLKKLAWSLDVLDMQNNNTDE